MTEREQSFRQIERVVASKILHGSESLCRLLRYLGRHSLDSPGVPLKEYTIATEEFGRPPNFDAQLDSMIRVQAGRLRAKLAEYYNEEGKEDAIRIELPKGTYLLNFHHRAPTPAKGNLVPVQAKAGTPTGWFVAVVILSIFLAVAIGALLADRKIVPIASAGTGQTSPPSPAFETFWKPFLVSSDTPWVVFSNAAFIGRPETGMRYYNPANDPKAVIWDHYTGVGEVLAVHNLDQAFSSLHRNIRVKRGSLFSLDDAKNNQIIFVGSPSENLNLLEIPGTQDFVFRRVTSGPRKGDLAVANLHPESGEASEYLASPSNVPLAEDYAVVALVQGLNQGRTVMIIAGTTTFGTQGAVEYVCRQNSVEQLLKRLNVSQSGEIKPFEALLRIKVAKGVPVDTQLIAARPEGH